jgi:polar amino acid transport system substrate-binding protein
MVGFNRRFSPLARELKRFFSSRREPLIMNYRVNAGAIPGTSWIHDPAQGGGRILGEVCHFVDFLSDLCAARPRLVFAQAAQGGSARSDDNVVISISFADGSVATIAYVATGDATAGKERLEVLGDGAWAQLDDYRELRLRRGGKERVVRKLSADKGHRAEVREFFDAVRVGGPPPIAIVDIAASSRATFAVVESLASGRPVEVEI